jgi:polar amino acid transport system substrate-binding protein
MISLFSSLSLAEENRTYQFLSGDFEPYTSSTMKNGGIATEIVKKAVSAMGHNVEITYLPWRRGHLLALEGEYFAIYPYSESKERKEKWFYSDPLYNLEEYIFVKRDRSFTYENNDDLKGKTICRPKGYNLFGLNKLQDQGLVTIEQPSDLAACFLMLNIGRVDVVLINKETGWSMIETLQLKKQEFATLGKTYLSNRHHLIISKKIDEGEAFLKDFNQELRLLKQSGEIERILERSK